MDDRDDSRDVAAEQEQMHRDEVLFRIDRIEGWRVMRCRACDVILSDNELRPRKVVTTDPETGGIMILHRYEDMCSRCWDTQKYDVDSWGPKMGAEGATLYGTEDE